LFFWDFCLILQSKITWQFCPCFIWKVIATGIFIFFTYLLKEELIASSRPSLIFIL
jgi:hypothetical protein